MIHFTARPLPGGNPLKEAPMAISRRKLIRAASAAALASLGSTPRAQAGVLKISHQFPSGTLSEGDFRDRLCRRFAADIQSRSNGALKAEVYPGSSLMKTNSQFAAMRKGALDFSLVPLSYAGGEVAETNIGLMPALVPSYEVGAQWKTSEVGRLLAKLLDDKGIVVVSWIWQAGGVASRAAPLVAPDDAKGMKVRGGSREMDMMLKAAGASVITLPSNEIYAAMQTGAMDAAMTSSTSFISFKLEEIAKNLTSGRNKAYWFMFEPLLMSKEIFAKLPKAQQDIVMAAGAEQEKFALDAAKADDKIAADVYAKAGAKVFDLDEPTVKKWQTIARETAWKDYGERGETSAALLKAAQKLLA
jgi:TRAP-type transport system periplasmic protein